MNFYEFVAANDVVVRFTAKWCGPCQKMTPIIEELKSDGYRFFDVDIDSERELVETFGIMSVPTFIFFKDGKKESVLVGGTDKETLKTFASGAKG